MEQEPQLTGWGRIPGRGRELVSEDLERLTERAVLSRGLGRAYGDSALPPPSVGMRNAQPRICEASLDSVRQSNCTSSLGWRGVPGDFSGFVEFGSQNCSHRKRGTALNS